MKLRLLITDECDRECAGCCNNDWDLSGLVVEKDFTKYELIMLTGGEPMLDPVRLLDVVALIRRQTSAPIYVYTALVSGVVGALAIISVVDGMTVTLHEQSDVAPFIAFNKRLAYISDVSSKSLRLNIFKGIDIDTTRLCRWQIKDNIEWINDCPLPDGEAFKRICPNEASK